MIIIIIIIIIITMIIIIITITIVMIIIITRVVSRMEIVAFKRYRHPKKCPKKWGSEKQNCCYLVNFWASLCAKQYKSTTFFCYWGKLTRPQTEDIAPNYFLQATLITTIELQTCRCNFVLHHISFFPRLISVKI